MHICTNKQKHSVQNQDIPLSEGHTYLYQWVRVIMTYKTRISPCLRDIILTCTSE